MKILHISHHYKPCIGGVEKVVEELCSNLKKQGQECKVFCLNRCHNGKKMLAIKEQFPEVKVERLEFANMNYYKFAPFRLSRLKEFDLIHVHGLGFFADFLAITKFLHKKPLVLSTHGGIFHTKSESLLKKAYFGLWGGILTRFFDKIIAVSQHDAELFSKIAPAKKISVIENGINFEKFSSVKGAQDSKTFLYFGRLSKNKGLRELIEAFSLVCEKNTQAKLVIVGKDFDRLLPGLKKKAKALGIANKVLFKGEVTNKQLLNLMGQAGTFVSASHYEGFGISAVEAMAAGLLPVLNAIDSFKKFVKTGHNGFLADFSNKEDAAKQMELALKLGAAKRKRLVTNAKKFASGFDWETKTKEHIKIYSQCGVFT
jgi:alpha-1,3-mannosyltransferase